MKKLLLSLCYIIILLSNTVASVIDSSSAVLVAINWHYLAIGDTSSILNVIPQIHNNIVTRYIINFNDNSFVMCSGTDAANPILGYSIEHNFQSSDISPELEWLLSNMDSSLTENILNNVTNNINSLRWTNLLAIEINNIPQERYTAGNNLLKTTWNQTWPYNDQVNVYDYSHCSSVMYHNKCSTGCVATAMAQIMKYWNFPYGFDWCNMPEYLDANSPASHINAVASLMADIGRKLKMDYCNDEDCGSGACVKDYHTNIICGGASAEAAFVDAYNYNDTYVDKPLLSTQWPQWYLTLKNEIDNERPILYTGGTHAWVIDGYSNLDYHLFYMNFGWGGTNNSYYTLEAIPQFTQSDLNSNQAALINIAPVAPVYCNKDWDIYSDFGSYFYNHDGCNLNMVIPGGHFTNSGNVTAIYLTDCPQAITLLACYDITLANFKVENGLTFVARIENLDCPPINGNRQSSRNIDHILDDHYSYIGKSSLVANNAYLRVFPNPITELVQVSFSSDTRLIELLTIDGKLLSKYNISNGQISIIIPTGSLSNGIYIIRSVGYGENAKHVKLVKCDLIE